MSSRWDRFFHTPEPVYAAIYFRVFLSFWTVAFFIPRLPYLDELYTALAIHTPHPLWDLVGGPPMLPLAAVWAVVLSLFLCLLGFAAGYRPRDMHLLILLHLAYLFGFDISILRGYGELAFYQWLLCWFMPYDTLQNPDGQVREAPPWGSRLVMLQFSLVYLFTIGAKTIGGEGWLDGRTLYYALHGRDYGSFLFSAWYPPGRELARVLGWATLVGELFVGLGLWSRRTRPWAMAACVGLHLGMALNLRVSLLFHLLMVGHLPLFFAVSTWERRLRRQGTGGNPVLRHTEASGEHIVQPQGDSRAQPVPQLGDT